MLSERDGIEVAGLGANVLAWMSTRAGGVSQPPFDHLNLGRSVGDDPAAVAENQARVAALMGAPLNRLHQVHGARCVAVLQTPDAGSPLEPADASCTTRTDLTLMTQAADCLPVLLSAVDDRGQALAVAGAHAGWRGLAAGVLETTVQRLRALAPQATECRAWLGPCIGPTAFEVGADVLQAFPDGSRHFRFTPRADGDPRWHADLQGLAADRLYRAGVLRLQRESACTFSEPSRFFSFRRDGVRSGRMAAFIRRLP